MKSLKSYTKIRTNENGLRRALGHSNFEKILTRLIERETGIVSGVSSRVRDSFIERLCTPEVLGIISLRYIFVPGCKTQGDFIDMNNEVIKQLMAIFNKL